MKMDGDLRYSYFRKPPYAPGIFSEDMQELSTNFVGKLENS